MTDPQHEETFADTERKLREIITTLRAQLAEARANEAALAEIRKTLAAPDCWHPVDAVKALKRSHDRAEAQLAEAQRLMRLERTIADKNADKADRAEAALAAQIEKRKTFPILGQRGASVDFQLVADHAEQANRNHYQTVDRLAARGGLSWCELFAVLHNQPWKKVDTNEAMIACRALEARYLAAVTHDRMLTEAREKALREASDELRGQGYGNAVRTILALIEKPNAG